jgi:hypothetical protein
MPHSSFLIPPPYTITLDYGDAETARLSEKYIDYYLFVDDFYPYINGSGLPLQEICFTETGAYSMSSLVDVLSSRRCIGKDTNPSPR